MRVVELLQKKRDGHTLTSIEIDAFVHAAASGSWPDYQLSALLMAICIRGMTADETAQLTSAMANSGVRINLDSIPGTKIDKHSTGGVGDKTSLILAPLAAACGVVVPMMSGRGLGHTGGTLDKLEAIPGFRVDLSIDQFERTLAKVGMAMIGQSADVAPADRKLYALRDVTGTVESVPLITASILSKKLAEGISGLVMDVKCGQGAFMKTLDDARTLAESLVRVGTLNGLQVEAIITNMESPLGHAVGNAVETIEAIETLHGNGPKDLETLSIELAARMVRMAGQAETLDEAQERVREALESGAALEKLRDCIERQGGDPEVIDNFDRFPQAPHVAELYAPESGTIETMNAEQIGIAALLLGAGRMRAEDRVDHAIGIHVAAKPGDVVKHGESPLYRVHYRDEASWTRAEPLLKSACIITDNAVSVPPLILESV